MEDELYKIKFELKTEYAYEEVDSLLDEISFSSNSVGDFTNYFLDENKEKIVRLNPKNKTVELTDKIDKWIINSIEHVKKVELIKGKL